MINAGRGKEIIFATGALVVNPTTVRMAGRDELPIHEFDEEVNNAILLKADSRKHAARAVALHAKDKRPKIISR